MTDSYLQLCIYLYVTYGQGDGKPGKINSTLTTTLWNKYSLGMEAQLRNTTLAFMFALSLEPMMHVYMFTIVEVINGLLG